MSRPSIGIVADDLTGAADTAVGFLCEGLSAVVTWPDAGVDQIRSPIDADVVAIDTRSRAADVRHARTTTAAAVSRLRDAGVETLYKKIDSMLRGHIGDETHAAMAAWDRDGMAIVAPAFPANGRTTLAGRQCLNGAPVAGVPGIAALFEQAGLPTRQVSLQHVRRHDLAALLSDCCHQRIGAVVCDAVTNHDLRTIARAGARLGPRAVWVGSGGLAHAMAHGRRRERPDAVERRAPRRGAVLIVVGSTQPIARQQAAALVDAGVRPIVVAPATIEAAHDPGPWQAIVDELREGTDVVVTIGDDAGTSGGDDPALTARLGERLRPCAPVTAGLILTGGDTAFGLLRAWGTMALRLAEEIAPGVVRSFADGPHPVPVVTKSGSFGTRDTLVQALARLHRVCAVS